MGYAAGMNTAPAPLEVTSERVDDLPVLIGVLRQIGLAQLYDQTVSDHGLHQGLSGGWLAMVWLAHILSRGKHTKSPVREWVAQHQALLSRLIGQPIRPTDFTDDRLGSLLHRLADPARWEAFEAAWWARSLVVLPSLTAPVEWPTFHVDSTTAWGYHAPQPDGLMRRGQSKDHRADLPQMKLMTLADQVRGYLLVSQVHPGQAADEPLYLPLIDRARQVLGRRGLVFVGDTKMAPLATRASLAAAGDYYLTVLPLKGELQDQLLVWLAQVASGERATSVLEVAGERLGIGFEIIRELQAQREPAGQGQTLCWPERVVVFRSDDLAEQKVGFLRRRLATAEAKLRALAPPPGQARRAWRDPAALRQREDAILVEQDVGGLLTLHHQCLTDPRPTTGRRSRSQPARRYVIADVERNAAAIAAAEAALGWRVQATNVPATAWTMSACIWQYRQNWPSERNYHLLKAEPLGLSPLYVHNPDQIAGLTYLLTVAARVLRLIEMKMAEHLRVTGQTVSGLYAGQPTQATAHPTAVAMLNVLARAQITLTEITLAGQRHLHLSALPPIVDTLLAALGLPSDLYTGMAVEPQNTS